MWDRVFSPLSGISGKVDLRLQPLFFAGDGRRGGEKTSSVLHSLDSFPVRGEAVNPVEAAARAAMLICR